MFINHQLGSWKCCSWARWQCVHQPLWINVALSICDPKKRLFRGKNLPENLGILPLPPPPPLKFITTLPHIRGGLDNTDNFIDSSYLGNAQIFPNFFQSRANISILMRHKVNFVKFLHFRIFVQPFQMSHTTKKCVNHHVSLKTIMSAWFQIGTSTV